MSRRRTGLDCTAKERMERAGVNFNSDFHALPRAHVDMVLAWAKESGYRKSKSASGSRARMYFQRLARMHGCKR